MGVKVAKFGGSSVADAIQIKKIKDIVERDDGRKLIVVSAPGKRFEQDSKITDLLYSCIMHRDHNLPFDQLFQVIYDRYTAVAVSLSENLAGILKDEFEKIKNDLAQGADKDYIVSRGEYLNGKLIAAYLGYDFIDVSNVIKFDQKGKFLDEETNNILKETLVNHEKAVVPGFYGAKPDGSIQTFSRGGSDITGALIARAVKADVYENWTDVSGLSS